MPWMAQCFLFKVVINNQFFSKVRSLPQKKTVASISCATSSYAEEFEVGRAKVYDDKMLILLLVADMQGGVIVGWNAIDGKIEHVSGEDYALDTYMDSGSVYFLTLAESFGNDSRAYIEKVEYGSIYASAKTVNDMDLFKDHNGNIESVSISVDGNEIFMVINDNEFRL